MNTPPTSVETKMSAIIGALNYLSTITQSYAVVIADLVLNCKQIKYRPYDDTFGYNYAGQIAVTKMCDKLVELGKYILEDPSPEILEVAILLFYFAMENDPINWDHARIMKIIENKLEENIGNKTTAF